LRLTLALLGDDLAHLVDASIADEQFEVGPRGREHDFNVLAALVTDKTPVAFIVANRSGASKCEVALSAGLVALVRQLLDELLCG
jgi:hypothetical protein